jgi:hypothetical protein
MGIEGGKGTFLPCLQSLGKVSHFSPLSPMLTIRFFLFRFFFWDRVSLCSPDWPQIHHSSTSAIQLLGLVVCITMPGCEYVFCQVKFCIVPSLLRVFVMNNYWIFIIYFSHLLGDLIIFFLLVWPVTLINFKRRTSFTYQK